MKIIHTADWHLGKKIEGRSMLCQQRCALDELCEAAFSERPDALIIAGDVFDTAVPSSEAEELFFDACMRLSEHCGAVVAIAGNHDDETRLCAARSMAAPHRIYLVGDMDNTFYDGENAKGGKGWLRLTLPGGTLNLALLPYPLETVTGGGEDEYVRRVEKALSECAEVFSPDGVNVLAAHLFMLDGSEEKVLGGARILPSSILPANAAYVALGHVHKPLKVRSSPPAYYSGSIIPCNFTETEARCVKVAEFSHDAVTIRDIELKSVKKLVRIAVKSYAEAYEKLSACEHYAEVLYDSPEPVTPAEMTALRALPAFVKFTPCYVRGEEKSEGRKLMTDEQLFEAFYSARRGSGPDDDERELFRKAVAGEEIL